MTIIDFDALKVAELYLHTLLSRATGHITGKHEVDIAATNLMPQYKLRVAEWATLHAPASVVAPTPAATEPQISMAQIEAEQKQDIQRRVNKARAIQRANDYVRDAGLAESDANGKLIREWIDNAGGVWKPELIDAAIENLNNQLEWRSTEPAPEPEKPEILGMLKDGSQQLPIDVPDWKLKLKTTSVEQAKDV